MTWLRAVLVTVAGAALAGGIDACTSSSSSSPSSSKPALCSAVAQLKTSVTNLAHLDLSANAINKLQSELNTVRANVQTVSNAAHGHYSSDVAQVRASTAAVQTAATDAKNNPSATTFTSVATSVKTLASDVTALANDVKSTC
jgi:hypothetical protein